MNAAEGENMARDDKEKGSRSLRALAVIESVVAADRPVAVLDIMTASARQVGEVVARNLLEQAHR